RRRHVGAPGCQRVDVVVPDDVAVFVTEQVLEQDPERKWQALDRVTCTLECLQREYLVDAVADLQRGPAVQAPAHARAPLPTDWLATPPPRRRSPYYGTRTGFTPIGRRRAVRPSTAVPWRLSRPVRDGSAGP